MIQNCETCKIEIVAEDVVVSCEGLCEDQRYYHARCVGLSYDEGCACLHQNIFWMCDPCRDSIEKARFRKAFGEKQNNEYATQDEIDCLKSEVNRISEVVSKMATNITTAPNQSTSTSTQCTYHHSPLSSTKLFANDPAPNESLLQLYVSNIAPDVTENEVKQMVCESIGAPNVLDVKCLVPPWKDVSTLNYVSFKVTVDAQFRESAFRISNWPSGVRLRQFRDYYNSVWRPSTRMVQLST